MCFLPMILSLALFFIIPQQKAFWAYLISCALGIAAVIPASFIQFFALKLTLFKSHSFASILLSAIIFNGLIEEGTKLGAMLLLPRKKLSLWTFFCSSVLLGMAAGSLETVIYLMTSLQRIALVSDQNATIRLVFARMFSSQAIHALCAALSGLFLWGCKGGIRHAIIVCWAVALHGLFNFFIAFSQEFRLFAIVAILLAAVECRIWYKIIRNSEEISLEELTQSKEKDTV